MRRRELLVWGIALIAMTGVVRAADKPDPTGTWKWSMTYNDQKRDFTLKLKMDGDKLTGTVVGGRSTDEVKIDDATFKDGEVAFSVTRERNGQKNTSKYKGKLDGDNLKGTIEFDRNGQTGSRDWEAKREKTA